MSGNGLAASNEYEAPASEMQYRRNMLESRLKVLREQYVRDYPERIRELRHSLQIVISGGSGSAGTATFHRQAHSLKGSGAMYGFPLITDLAARVDAIAAILLRDHSLPDAVQTRELNALLEQMESLCLDEIAGESILGHEFRHSRQIDNARNNNLILVLDVNDETRVLQEQLLHYGYKVVIRNDIQQLIQEIGSGKPAAILMDIDLHEKSEAGFRLMEQLRKECADLPPVIFVCDRDPLELRIRAVREGGVSYIRKPMQFGELADVLDVMAENLADEPYRILIVEDNASLADFISATLESAGMETCVITEPLDLLEQMSHFNPELVLMDMYMPGCDGAELAAVIRQVEAYVSIPIVYLSGEKNIDKQLKAMSLGADDFLTKPIEPRHLISSVETRASRYRTLRSLMVRDSLTNLYNHTKTKELLDRELYRSIRNMGRLAFAVLDIDEFKSVNDTYGHPVGDRVIRSLARLLKQRLRKSDIVGRYGGEEFAVILHDTDLENAGCIMDDLRENFSRIIHKSQDASFQATISCGIAAFPEYKTAAELIAEADKAMYRAKREGRNRVKLALPVK